MEDQPIQIAIDSNKLIERQAQQIDMLTRKNIEFEVYITQQHETITKLEAALASKDQEQIVPAEVATMRRKAGKE